MRPCSSTSSCGSTAGSAPRLTASSNAWSASSTWNAMSRTPSPCSLRWSAGGCSGESGVRDDEPRLALLQRVGRHVALARLEPGIGELREAEGLAVEEGRLLGVADPELDVVDLPQLERVVGHASIIPPTHDDVPAWRMDPTFSPTGGRLDSERNSEMTRRVLVVDDDAARAATLVCAWYEAASCARHQWHALLTCPAAVADWTMQRRSG